MYVLAYEFRGGGRETIVMNCLSISFVIRYTVKLRAIS